MITLSDLIDMLKSVERLQTILEEQRNNNQFNQNQRDNYYSELVELLDTVIVPDKEESND